MFRDSETGLVVVRDSVVDAAEPFGRLTQDWIRAGGLILIGSPQEPVASEGGDSIDGPSSSAESPAQFVDQPETQEDVSQPEKRRRGRPPKVASEDVDL